MKKLFTILFIFIFVSITIMQYRENLILRREPPSGEWAKEVLLSSGNITDYPQLIKYNDKYVVAHVDGDRIKILTSDNVGKKLSEKIFPARGELPRNVHIVANEEGFNLSWIISDGDMKNLHSLILDKEFNIKSTSTINNVEDLKQISNDLLVISFNNTIKVIDYKSGKSSEVSAPFNSLVCGTKLNDKYIVAFRSADGDFSYFLVNEGMASEIKHVGLLKEITRTYYDSAAVAIEENKGYIVAEYRYQGMYGGAKIMEFELDGSGYRVRETADKDRVIYIYNIVSYTEGNNSGVKFLAGGYRPFGKKESYEDILNLEVKNGIINNSTPVSRTRALSGFPSGYEDTLVFCDVVGIDYSNLYMTSSREDFKRANNTNRNNEVSLAFLDTSQGILYTFIYLVAYGILWIIPSFCIAAILSLFEYRLSKRSRKSIFIATYFIAFAFKAYFIYTIIFKRFRYFLPHYLTPAAGIGASLIISIICCAYAYKKYIINMERNAISLNFSPLFILDSWFTLFLFVPFIK